MILSLTPGNADELYDLLEKKGSLDLASQKTFVLLPDLSAINRTYNPDEVVRSLICFYEQTKKKFPKSFFILDPILNPPGNGFLYSVCTYQKLLQLNRERIPVLFGTGNVVELIDADSVGANAILASLASEAEACILFTPQASDKSQGSVHELRQAADMMFLARTDHIFPKDMGIDLLEYKEKRKRDESPVASIPYICKSPFCFCFNAHGNWTPDKGGNFYIFVITKRNLLTALDCNFNEGSETKLQNIFLNLPENERLIVASHPEKIFVGNKASKILEHILDSGLVTELSHAAYLGREFQKAEIAILQNRSYLQDDTF